MAKFKNDKGLTLIELLITIAVLAVVSAIALPVINNVVSASNSNATTQTQNDVTDFIAKYNGAGTTLYANGVFSGYVDTDGDNTIDSNELVDTLTLDAKFSANVSGNSASVGGSYTTDGITGATIAGGTGSALPGGNTGTGGTTYSGLSYKSGFSAYALSGTGQYMNFQSYVESSYLDGKGISVPSKTITVQGPAYGMPCLTDIDVYNTNEGVVAMGSVTSSFDGMYCTYSIDIYSLGNNWSTTIDPATHMFVIHQGSAYPLAPFSLTSN